MRGRRRAARGAVLGAAHGLARRSSRRCWRSASSARPPRSSSPSSPTRRVARRALPLARAGDQHRGLADAALLVAVGFQAIDPDAGVGWRSSRCSRSRRPWTMALNFVDRPAARSRSSTAARSRSSLRRAGRARADVRASTSRCVAIAEIYARARPHRAGLRAAQRDRVHVHGAARRAARERTREYANLSWGVLSGLIRTLDERDSRAARHCAAVAALLARHRRARADVQARPGARAHRRPAARHRQVRALRPRDGARRPARGVRLARHPPPPRHRRRAAARHRRLRPGRARSSAPTTSASTAAATRAA